MSSAIAHVFNIGSEVSGNLVGINSAARAVRLLAGGNVTDSSTINGVFDFLGSNSGSYIEFFAAGFAIIGSVIRLFSVYCCATYKPGTIQKTVQT